MKPPYEGVSGSSGSMLQAFGVELAAFASFAAALPWRALASDTLAETDKHPVPVVFVHGILGHATNFAALRQDLSRRGIRRFSSFSYRPRLDYQRLASELGSHIEDVCRTTGAAQVDLVGHSLGGLAARYFVQTGGSARVRRLVTLGTPYLAHANPRQELAIFGAADPIVPPPADRARRHMLVVDGCGHLGLLTNERALAAVVRHLARPFFVRVGGLAA